MKNKKIYIMFTIYIVVVVIFFTSLIYGWWVPGITSPKVSITTAKIASQIDVYEGIDFDHDGIFDYSIDVNADNIDNNGHYNYIDTVKDSDKGKDIILSSVTNFHPTKTLTYRFNFTNKGDADGYIVIDGNVDGYEENEIYFLKCLSISVCVYDPLDSNSTYSFCDKIYLKDIINSDTFNIFTSSRTDVVEKYAGSNSKYKKDLIVKIEFEPYSELDNIIDEETYKKNLQNMTFNKTIFLLTLSSHIS